MRRDEGLLHLGKVAVIFGPFDPLGNEGSLGDPSGNEGSPPLRERRDPSPGGTLDQTIQDMKRRMMRKELSVRDITFISLYSSYSRQLLLVYN